MTSRASVCALCAWLAAIWSIEAQDFAPSIGTEPVSQAVNQGSNATFFVIAPGTAPLAYQWFFNQTNSLPGKTSSSLNLTNVQATNQGAYSLLVTNALGSVTSKVAILTVLARPTIIIQPKAQTVAEGEDVTFGVSVTNIAALPIRYEWRKGLTSLTNVLLNATTSSFTLHNVQTNVTEASGPGSYRVTVSNALSAAASGSFIVSLTVIPPVPPGTPVTGAANDISGNGATLNGTVNPNRSTTLAWFEYGLNESYGGTTRAVSAGNGTNAVALSVATVGLLPNTTYHFRLAASNRAGITNGQDRIFTTTGSAPVLPVIVTLPPVKVTMTNATLSGTVNPNGSYAVTWFEYGPTTNYGFSSTATNVVHGSSLISLSNLVANLSAGASYHYRVAASNSAGTIFGEDQLFQTLAPPEVVTLSANLDNSPDVVLRGSVDPNGSPVLVHFDYGFDSAYGSRTVPIEISNGTDPVLVNDLAPSLAGYTDYHFRIVAVSAAGTNYGSDETFILAAPQPFTFTTLAGEAGGTGSSDGAGSAAGFNFPSGAGVDSAGNLYIADSGNSTIRKIAPDGVVSTFAGLAGNPGCADGTGSAARFNFPTGLAVDSSDNIYIADRFNHTIRKITPGGIVSTYAGVAGFVGSVDGPGSAARFTDPRGVAVDNAGNVYVSDSANFTIRKITPGRVVTTLAGLAGNSGSANGQGSVARFGANPGGGTTGPGGLAADSAGNVYVADTFNSTIRKITPGGAVSTLAGLAGNAGSQDGTGSGARFYYPEAVAVDGLGNVYVADTDTCTIRRITPNGEVTTLAGQGFYCGARDGTGDQAQFLFPWGVAVDAFGNVYVGDSANHTIRKINPLRQVTTLAGRTSNPGSLNGIGRSARFYGPYGVAIDRATNIYVADSFNHTIRKITPSGEVSTFAGSPRNGGTNDGIGSNARFNSPAGLALDSLGYLYVADSGNSTIRKISPDGEVITLAGLAGAAGSADGPGSTARFYYPSGVAVDGSGNVYVGDVDNCTIRKITPAGLVSTLAGTAEARGINDGFGSAARFWYPSGVAVDGAGNVYVADTQNSAIRKITPDGMVTTLAGLAFVSGSVDGVGSAARFNGPVGIALDAAENIYVADYGNQLIRRITPFGNVTTLGGLSGNRGSEDGTGSAAHFNNPSGVAVDSDGTIYVADYDNNTIRRGRPALILITRQPASQTVMQGTMAAFVVETSSTRPVAYQWQYNGVDITSATNATLLLNGVAPNQSGNYSVVAANELTSVISSIAALTVIGGAPSLTITDQPLSQTVSSGTTVTLSVGAIGNPPPAYQWRRNGVSIPGAVDPTLTLSAALPTDGGRYTVVVSSLAGISSSEPADVIVTSPALPFADNFINRQTNLLSSGVGSGNNLNATRELSERDHAQKPGAKSVWYSWRAPATGIATFSTIGSSFDTLLAVYTGSALSNLVEVASDDDRPGFLNSQVSFKAFVGTVYHVAVDGFAGASGNVVLSWSLDTSISTWPRFILQPLSQTVTNGGNVSFSVQVDTQTAFYQWYFNCEVIPPEKNSTATSATLIVTNAGTGVLGSYTVRVHDGTYRWVESLPAFLEIGPQSDARSQDKLEDLFGLSGGANLLATAPKGSSSSALALSSGFVSVSAGSVGSQLLNNFGATTQEGEPNACGVIGGSSRWFAVQPTVNGVMVVDTIGSAIDTIVAVYVGTSILNLTEVACDDNGASDGVRSLVRWDGVAGTKYSVAVDGVGGAQGVINLNWRLGTSPQFIPQPVTNLTVRLGDSVMLAAGVVDVLPSPNYQWRLNGRNISGATTRTLDLRNLQLIQSGVYTLVASNFIGAATNTIATVAVAMPVPLAFEMTKNNGVMHFQLMGASSSRFALQVTTNLTDWTNLYIHEAGTAPWNFLDLEASNHPARFYRIIWP